MKAEDGVAEDLETEAAEEAPGEVEGAETAEPGGAGEGPGGRWPGLDGDAVHRWAVAALVLVGAALRIAYITQPMAYMESLTYIAFSSRPLAVGLSHYTWPNNQLLNTLLSHLSSGLLGNEPWAIRLPALVFGILLLPAVYLAGRRLYDKHAGLLALALTVPASQLIGFSAQARGYTMQAFFFLTLILCAASLLREERFLAWAGFVLSAVLGFYAVPTMLYFFPPVYFWFAWSGLRAAPREKRKGFARRCLLAGAAAVFLVLLSYLPVILTTGLSSITSNQYVASQGTGSFLSGLPGNCFDMWSSWNVVFTTPVALLFLGGFAVAVALNRRVSRYPVNLPFMVMAWCLLLMCAQRALPFVRNWMPLAPLYYIAASAGLIYAGKSAAGWLRRRRSFKARLNAAAGSLLALALALALAALAVTAQTAYQKDEMGRYTRNTFRDAEEVALFLRDKLGEGDVVFSDTDYIAVPLQYYFIKYGIPLEHLVVNVPRVEDYPRLSNQVTWEDQLAWGEAWNSLGLRPGGPESLRRAFFIVACGEYHYFEDSLGYAVSEIGGLKVEDFYDTGYPVLDTGFTQLLVFYRKT